MSCFVSKVAWLTMLKAAEISRLIRAMAGQASMWPTMSSTTFMRAVSVYSSIERLF